MQQKLRLCRTHCRSFIALWLFPAFVLFALLSARRAAAAGSRGVALISVLSIIIYAAIAQVPSIGLWRRREITYWQMQLLTTPAVLVAGIRVMI
jgi:hypothetical protein